MILREKSCEQLCSNTISTVTSCKHSMPTIKKCFFTEKIVSQQLFVKICFRSGGRLIFSDSENSHSHTHHFKLNGWLLSISTEPLFQKHILVRRQEKDFWDTNNKTLPAPHLEVICSASNTTGWNLFLKININIITQFLMLPIVMFTWRLYW